MRPTSGDVEGAQRMANAPEPALTVAAVARRLGVAPATLRTWDRRYGLGPSSHTAGAHRRYTAADLARLTLMRRLTLEGVPPAEAAAIALARASEDAVPELAGSVPAGPPALPVAGPEERLPAEVTRLRTPPPGLPEAAASRATPGGGRVLAIPGGSAASRGLARAAMALDAHVCREIIRSSLQAKGVVATWNGLLTPVLAGIGARWAETGEGVEVEHLLSEVVMSALRAYPESVSTPINGRPVLLACSDSELHSLPLHALSAALAERSVASRMLGGQMPPRALSDAVRRTGPAAVFVWASLPAHADPSVVAGLPVQRPAGVTLLGGPGWVGRAYPPGAEVVTSLSAAVDAVLGAVTAQRA
ncbi:MerR family transcriptional regulator [Motilibacter aurantiacus]|uniref:MerR family transcriptional regulator n=1 Tax=Motilibacter aurantiacus TaxID=2714955 RepID=UPI00140C2BBE|nr:MerR family transcriptional regulator [Motilibacter aurantiacus]NHC43991.1 MerR family transcriptional regulator [Motilibacter aurantiacus]